jgi:hypothetical protein
MTSPELLALIAARLPDNATEAITPAALREVLTALVTDGTAPVAQVRQELGDPALLPATGADRDLVHYVLRLTERIAALEAAERGAAPLAPPEHVELPPAPPA